MFVIPGKRKYVFIVLTVLFELSEPSFLTFSNYFPSNTTCENQKLCLRKNDNHHDYNVQSEGILNEWKQEMDNSIMQNWIKTISKSTLVDFYVPSVNNMSTCFKQIQLWRKGVENSDQWALEMIDSWGKISDGSLNGIVDVPGFYDQCIEATCEEDIITGRYCTVYYTNEKNKKISGIGELQTRLGVLSGQKQDDFSPDYNTYGTCVPHGCSDDDMKNGLARSLLHSKRNILRVSCSNDNGFFEDLSLGGYLFVIYIGLLVLVMLVALLFTFTNRKPKSGLEHLIYIFCPLTNLKQIFLLDDTDNKEDSIKCLHGLRVITMVCIHLCHELGMTVHASNIGSSYVVKKPSIFIAFIVTSASLGVDTFLFISGLLISYSTLKATKVKPIQLYTYRLLRLTPPVVVVVWFFATVGGRWMSGPWFSEYRLIENACQKYWWKDVFFIFNFFPISSNIEAFPTCIGQSWYTAVDFQIFLIAPLLIYLILTYPSKAWSIMGFSTMLFFSIPTFWIYIYDFAPTNMLKLEGHKNAAYYRNIYVIPWHRAAPWFVGFTTGYAILKTLEHTYKLQKQIVIACWSVSLLLGCGVFYTMMQFNIDSASYERMADVPKAIYGGTHRGLWAVALAWIVYACQNGYGGLASFLEYPGFQPLSRLSYSIFLVSLNIQFLLSWSSKRPIYVSVFSKFLEACGSFIVCTIASVLLSLLTELPINNFMKKTKKEGSIIVKKNS